jgi:hypothetical protein
MKKITINQFHSIGDIIFIEPIIRTLIQCGYQVSLPIRDHLMWMAPYFEFYKRNVFRQMSNDPDFVDHHFCKPDYMPLRFANQILRGLDLNDHSDLENMMLDKYRLAEKQNILAGKSDWHDIQIKFNYEKGDQLFAKIYNGVDYVFVNEMSQAGNISIDTGNENTIKMQQIDGFTLFDWFILMLEAKEIHTVSTSILFVLQALHNDGHEIPPVFIYPRPNYDGLRGIKNLDFSYNFKLVENK